MNSGDRRSFLIAQFNPAAAERVARLVELVKLSVQFKIRICKLRTDRKTAGRNGEIRSALHVEAAVDGLLLRQDQKTFCGFVDPDAEGIGNLVSGVADRKVCADGELERLFRNGGIG